MFGYVVCVRKNLFQMSFKVIPIDTSFGLEFSHSEVTHYLREYV